MSSLSDAIAIVRSSLVAAIDTLLPARCAGCEASGARVCEACRAHLAGGEPTVQRLGEGSEQLVVWSAFAYEGVVARLLRSVKESSRPGILREFRVPLERALLAAASVGAGGPLIVVPVPVRRSSKRRRGFDVVRVAVDACGIRTRALLAFTRGVADQRELTREGRAQNLAGAMIARGAEGRVVVLVDDVCTTGATLREAARALRAGGASVVGAVVIAATPARSARAVPRLAKHSATPVNEA